MIPSLAHKLAEKLVRKTKSTTCGVLGHRRGMRSRGTGEGKSQGRKGRVTTDEAVSFLAVFTCFSAIRVGYP